MTSNQQPRGQQPPRRWPVPLNLASPQSPARQAATPLGVAATGRRRALVGLSPAGARHHVHVLGPTGTGKSTLLLNYALSQVRAGRGLAVFDPWGDLARNLLDRLPSLAADRLVLIDPDEHHAPPALNLFHLTEDPATVADQLVGVMAKVWARYWGPRTDDIARHAVLTLAHTPDATLADLPILLTDAGFRHRAIRQARHRLGPVEAATVDSFWHFYHQLSDTQQGALTGPLLARLRAVLSRRFAADLLGTTTSTFHLGDVLDGGILIARLPKMVLGEDTVRLVGSLLLAALWQTAGTRANQPEPDRLDTSLLVDECQNFLNLPIGLDHALAEARGLRLSLVLAHQHLGQLSRTVFDAVDANARNKVYFALTPADAHHLSHHTRPYFATEDLTDRDAHNIVCRLMVNGRPAEPFSLHTRPAPPAIPDRGELMRAAARQRGLPATKRHTLAQARLHNHHIDNPTSPATTGSATDSRRPPTGDPEPDNDAPDRRLPPPPTPPTSGG